MTEETNSAMISGEAGKIIEDAYGWYKSAVEDLEKVLETKRIVLAAEDGSDPIELTDERDLAIFQLGLRTALMRLGKFPLKIEVPAEEGEDE
ncbi:hypothetical protein [Acinetobacter nosocomialis]|uniref:hypothetical protein n=1 Tax=Acinetobacter nosocomialis TaxID=106654 RepID=UPI00339E4932